MNNVSIVKRTIRIDNQDDYRLLRTKPQSFILNFNQITPCFFLGMHLSGTCPGQSIRYELYNDFASGYHYSHQFFTGSTNRTGWFNGMSQYPINDNAVDFYLKANNDPVLQTDFEFVQFDFYFLKLDVISNL